VTDEKNKFALDEQTFQKLLQAAYVLQEHNREMRQMEQSLELHSEQLRQQEASTHSSSQSGPQPEDQGKRADADYTLTLAEIVEAQHQIQIRHLDSDKAMAVVAERIARITHASGAAIGILEGKVIRYHAGAGAPALPLGSEVPLEKAICAASVRTGQVLRTPDVNMEFLFDPELCRSRKIQSLLAVPVYHDGNIVGALELYFDRPQGYAEQDIHTCQLMAGLVTEAIGRASESTLKKSMAAERSSMLAAIEILKPNLVAIAEDKEKDDDDVAKAKDKELGLDHEGAGSPSRSRVEPADAENSQCWKCQAELHQDEQFCGKCGAPRLSMQPLSLKASASPSNGDALSAGSLGLRGNAASNAKSKSTESFTPRIPYAAPNSKAENPETENEHLEALLSRSLSASLLSPDTVFEPSASAAAKPAPPEISWASAAKAREFLEALGENRSTNKVMRFWRARRGDLYLAVAVVLVLVVILWGLSDRPVVGAAAGIRASGTATQRKNPAADAGLSAFDKFLISVGLADPPEAPEYKGNPDTQVWIDTHTALYYCPGSELYGNTPRGKYATQRDAQLDQFESASRKPCD
jgi:putative methionine-R-sulfoxide reductase with GAF domain